MHQPSTIVRWTRQMGVLQGEDSRLPSGDKVDRDPLKRVASTNCSTL